MVIDLRNNYGGFIDGHILDAASRRNVLTVTAGGLLGPPGRQSLGRRALARAAILRTNESSLSVTADPVEGCRNLPRPRQQP